MEQYTNSANLRYLIKKKLQLQEIQSSRNNLSLIGGKIHNSRYTTSNRNVTNHSFESIESKQKSMDKGIDAQKFDKSITQWPQQYLNENESEYYLKIEEDLPFYSSRRNPDGAGLAHSKTVSQGSDNRLLSPKYLEKREYEA